MGSGAEGKPRIDRDIHGGGFDRLAPRRHDPDSLGNADGAKLISRTLHPIVFSNRFDHVRRQPLSDGRLGTGDCCVDVCVRLEERRESRAFPVGQYLFRFCFEHHLHIRH